MAKSFHDEKNSVFQILQHLKQAMILKLYDSTRTT